MKVHGLDVDRETRCRHWHSARDIVAIRMKCCGLYYACKDCHDALAGHSLEAWPESDRNEKAILCGACRNEIAICDYLRAPDSCTSCGALFNPNCRLHHHFYFSLPAKP